MWGEGASWEELFESIRAYPAELKAPYEGEDQVGAAPRLWACISVSLSFFPPVLALESRGSTPRERRPARGRTSGTPARARTFASGSDTYFTRGPA